MGTNCSSVKNRSRLSKSNKSVAGVTLKEENQKNGKYISDFPENKNKKNIKDKRNTDLDVTQFNPLLSFVSTMYQDIREYYTLGNVIGEGDFSKVRICMKKSSDSKTKRLFAVKSINKQSIRNSLYSKILNELHLLTIISHPNIVKFQECFEDQTHFHLVMDFYKGGELFDRVLDRIQYNEKQIKSIIHSILAAIRYCHSMGITHRDLKPENIVFEKKAVFGEDEDCLGVKIIDFGMSAKYNKDTPFKTVLGTPYYIAPEILKGSYDQRCDVWSIGIITYLLCCGKFPFKEDEDEEENTKKIFQCISNKELTFTDVHWDLISEDAKDFIKKCLEKDYTKRFTSEDALKHEWFDEEIEVKKFMSDSKVRIYSNNNNNNRNKNQNCLSQMSTSITDNNNIKFPQKAVISCKNIPSIQEQEIYYSTKKIVNHQYYLKRCLLNMKKNSNIGEMKKIIFTCLMKNQLNEKEAIELRRIFQSLDKDKLGWITLNNLSEAYNSIGIKINNEEKSNLVHMFSQEQGISYLSFLVSSLDIPSIINQDSLEDVFDCLNNDKTNLIGEINIKNLLLRYGYTEKEANLSINKIKLEGYNLTKGLEKTTLTSLFQEEEIQIENNFNSSSDDDNEDNHESYSISLNKSH